MRCIIVSTAFPLRGGIAHFNALLAKNLSVRHEVETITFKRQYPKLLFPGKSQDETTSGVEPENLTPAPRLIDSINPFNWYIVAQEVSRRNPDLLIFKYWLPFFGPCFGTIARLVKKRTGAKVLFICDNIIPHERRPGDVSFTKYAFKSADYFIVQSQAVERDLQKHFPDARYRLVPHPVYDNFGQALSKDLARNNLNITAKHVLLFFGYIRQYKGLKVLLDTIKDIVADERRKKELLLLVVGEFYDDEQKYRQQVKELGIESNVRFVAEYVPNNEVATYFSASDVVVLPYRSATQSGIIQIAYNFDKPVIATDVGGLAEVVIHEKTGFIIPPDDKVLLAQAILRFYQEKKEEQFVLSVREEKKKYSWDHFIQQLEELVEVS